MHFERHHDAHAITSQVTTPQKNRPEARYRKIEHSASSDQSPARRISDNRWIDDHTHQATSKPQVSKAIQYHASNHKLPQVGRPSFQKLEKIFQQELAHMCHSPEKKPVTKKHSDSEEDIRSQAPLPTVQKVPRPATAFATSPSIQTKNLSSVSSGAPTRSKSPSGVQKLSQKAYIARLIGSIENLLSALYSQQSHKQKDYPKFETETRQLLTESERLLEELGEGFYMSHYDTCSRSVVRGKGRSLGPCSCVFKLQKDKDMIRILSNLRKALVTAGKKIDVPSLVLSKSRDNNKENNHYSSFPTKPSEDDFKIGVHSMHSGDTKLYQDLQSTDPVNKNIQDIERRLKQIQYQLAADQTPQHSKQNSQEARKQKPNQPQRSTVRGHKSPSTNGSISSRSKDTANAANRDRNVRPWDHEEILLVDDAKHSQAASRQPLESRGSLQNSQRSNTKRNAKPSSRPHSPMSKVVVTPEVVEETQANDIEPENPTSRFQVEQSKRTKSFHPMAVERDSSAEKWNQQLLEELVAELKNQRWEYGCRNHRLRIRKFRKEYILGGAEDDELKISVEQLEKNLRQGEDAERELGDISRNFVLITKLRECTMNLIEAAGSRLSLKKQFEEIGFENSRVSLSHKLHQEQPLAQQPRHKSRSQPENIDTSKPSSHSSHPTQQFSRTPKAQAASLGGATVTACAGKTLKLAQRRSSDCASPSLSAVSRSPTSISPCRNVAVGSPLHSSQAWSQMRQAAQHQSELLPQNRPMLPVTRSGSFNQHSPVMRSDTPVPTVLKLVSPSLLSVGYSNGDLAFHRLVRSGSKYKIELIAAFRAYDDAVTFLEVGNLSVQTPGDVLPCLLFSSSSSIANTGAVSVWDPNSPALVRRLTGHTGQITCLKAVDTLGVLLTGGADRKIAFWDLKTDLNCIRVLELNGGYPSALEFSQELCILCVGQACGQVSLWNMVFRNEQLQSPNLKALVNTGNQIRDISMTSSLQGHILIVTEDSKFGLMSSSNLQNIAALECPSLEAPVKDYFIIETADSSVQQQQIFDNCIVLVIDSRNVSHKLFLQPKTQWRPSLVSHKPAPQSSWVFRPKTQILIDEQGLNLITTDPASGKLIITALPLS